MAGGRSEGQQQWFHWALAVGVSLGLPVMLVMLMLRAPRWRAVVLVGGWCFLVR